MRIYLDTCCYNRAFDDQSSERIILESDAILQIRDEIKNNNFELVTSYALHYENYLNKNINNRDKIDDFLKKYKTIYIGIEFAEKLNEKVAKIMSTGIKTNDAYHIASAMIAKSDYFITVDDRLLKYLSDDIKIVNPIDFIKILEVKNDVK